MLLRNAIQKLIHSETLSRSEMMAAMNDIMSGDATCAQIAGFLVALEIRGLNVEELTTATKMMRNLSHKIALSGDHLVDIVGTGGDGAQTFNISTTTMFVVAAAGGLVAKHGNRSVSSSSGSADVLEYAGINLNMTQEQTKQCIDTLGIGFLFAPVYHPALKHAASARRELGVRTFFNVLGALTNPANATHLLIGVYARKWLKVIAQVLLNLNCQHALIVHSEDGLDEISISAPTYVAELKNQQITQYKIAPENFGFKTQPIDSLRVKNPAQSYDLMKSVLSNVDSPARDIVLLNAGAAIYVAGLAPTMIVGIKKAKEVLANGQALEKFEQLVFFSQHLKRMSANET